MSHTMNYLARNSRNVKAINESASPLKIDSATLRYFAAECYRLSLYRGINRMTARTTRGVHLTLERVIQDGESLVFIEWLGPSGRRVHVLPTRKAWM